MLSVVLIEIVLFVCGGLYHAYLADVRQQKITRAEKPGLAAIELGLLFFMLGMTVERLGIALAALFLAAPLRWIVHDLTMNLIRGKGINYTGSESLTDDILKAWEEKTGTAGLYLKFIALTIAAFAAYLVAT